MILTPSHIRLALTAERDAQPQAVAECRSWRPWLSGCVCGPCMSGCRCGGSECGDTDAISAGLAAHLRVQASVRFRFLARAARLSASPSRAVVVPTVFPAADTYLYAYLGHRNSDPANLNLSCAPAHERDGAHRGGRLPDRVGAIDARCEPAAPAARPRRPEPRPPPRVTRLAWPLLHD